ncbi:MAG TPA: response regulator, partial [Spirochaetota bacterium]|nr:response regulator [Spirochaetota bacterium]
LSMPDLDGLMLTRMIRNTDNPNKDTVIVALSAHAYRDHITMCREAGMNNFIGKPVDRERLLITISNMLKAKEDKRGSDS